MIEYIHSLKTSIYEIKYQTQTSAMNIYDSQSQENLG